MGAVMAGAYGDALAVEGGADVFGAVAIEDEGEHTGFFFGGADEAEAGNGLQGAGGVGQEVVLVAGDVGHADAVEVVDGGAEADGVGDVAGAGFEAAGRRQFVRG